MRGLQSLLIIGLSVSAMGCTLNGENVFAGGTETWDAKARQLSLVNRYKAFRYGVSRLTPPAILADPMAGGGKDAGELILMGNAQKPNDEVILASLNVYDLMKRKGTWSLCSDPKHLSIARQQEALIADPFIKKRYASYLADICP